MITGHPPSLFRRPGTLTQPLRCTLSPQVRADMGVFGTGEQISFFGQRPCSGKISQMSGSKWVSSPPTE